MNYKELIEKADFSSFTSDALDTVLDAEARLAKDSEQEYKYDSASSAKSFAYDILDGFLDNEIDFTPFTSNDEVSERVSEWADSVTDIYNYNLYITTVDFADYVVTAVEEMGLPADWTLAKLLQMGQYACYEELARDLLGYLEQYAE